MTILFFTTERCEAAVKCWPAKVVNPAAVMKTLLATCDEATDLVKVASDEIPAWGTQYKHRVRFTDLDSGETYRYAVELESGESYTNTFSTAPGLDTPVRFIAYSDSETIPPTYRDTDRADEYGRTIQWEVLEGGKCVTKTYHVSRSVGFASNLLHMASWKPNLYVIAGDLVARGGVQMFWDEFWKENAGGLGRGYGDPAGSVPILATTGNHDLYDNNSQSSLSSSYNNNGETGLKKFLSYFEFNKNDVDFANASGDNASEKDSRDKSQLFHREDYGPVTLLFVDTNNGTDSNGKYDSNSSLGSNARSPAYKKGSLQYKWLEANLKDARDVRKSRFIFVVNHHCPYSRGKHNNPSNGQTAAGVRNELTPLLMKYGVTGWICGHDEMQEHAQVSGTEELADGSTRPHTINVYDLGSAGDGLRGEHDYEDNGKYIVYSAYDDSPDGTHYGHLQVEVAPSNGTWYCTMTPAYSYFAGENSPSELRYYADRTVVVEQAEQDVLPIEEEKEDDLSAPNVFSVSPYVQHPATNAMSIIFFTTNDCAATVKVWRADGKDEAVVLKTEAVDVSEILKKNPDGSGDTVTYAKQFKHRVRFENLRTQTDYCYKVKPDGGASYSNVFRTLPGKDSPVRFIGICDTETQSGTTDEWHTHAGTGGTYKKMSYYVSRSVGYASNIVHMAARKPDLITISGDLAAKGGYQKYWDEFWKENAGVNAKGNGYNDIAGSIPILAAIGNHDLKEDGTVSSTGGGENPLKRYLTYFEYNSNGVHYTYCDGTTTKETRDTSQLFHRTDLGPVTLIFLDTNKGDNSDYTKETQHYAKRPAMRSPDFHPGTLQYAWLTNNLADAQRNSRFTFVINHHCPYSVGIHNREQGKNGYQNNDYSTNANPDGESARAVRVLTETMIRYGVDAWLCGHDEIQEHSQLSGTETLPDGSTRSHTLNVYDLGSGGDGLRGDKCVENEYEVFRAYEHEPDVWENGVLVSGGTHYGHMEVDVTTNSNGRWTCSLTPVYIFIYKDANSKVRGFERRCYKDRIIIDEETNRLLYQEWMGDTKLPDGHLEYVRPPQLTDEEIWTVLENPTFLPFTRVTRRGGVTTHAKVERRAEDGEGNVTYSLLTKPGVRYALGLEGKRVGDCVTGDGTPQLLTAPALDEGDYQVLTEVLK